MKLSVVTATYNRGPLVREMIEAALAQSRQPDEIIVSDDCSQDDTPAILEALHSQHRTLRIIRQPANSGGVMNWNHAVNAASGDLIAWCSDDDRFAPDHLKASEAYLKQNQDVGMVHSGFINLWQDDTGKTVEALPELYAARPFTVHGAEVVNYLIRQYSWPFHPSTLVFRRSLWESVGPFDPNYQLADTDWFIRAAITHKVAYLPRYGAFNRRHMQNWSKRTGAVRMHDEVNEAMQTAIARLDVNEARRDLLRARWTCFHLYRLSRLFLARSRAGRLEIAREVALSMRRSAGALQWFSEKTVVRIVDPLASSIRRIQGLFPKGVKRYEERERWEPQ